MSPFGAADEVRIPGDSGKFEIAAKVLEGAKRDDLKLMWQNLLVERFRLSVHREEKEMPAYPLVVAKGGLKIEESVDEPVPENSAPQPASDGPLQRDSEGYLKRTAAI